MNQPLSLALLTAALVLTTFRLNGIDRSAQVDLENAKGLADRGDFEAAIGALDAVLYELPGNDQAKLLRAEWMAQLRAAGEEAQRRQVVAKRTRRPQEYFEQWMSRTPNSELFSKQEMKVRGTLGDVEAKLLRALTNARPIFELQNLAFPEADLFSLRAIEDVGANGWRRCDLIGGEAVNGEVTLMFKVFEYAYPAQSRLPGLRGQVEEDMVPIHPSRLSKNESLLLQRREEGVRLMRLRILGATQH